MYGCTDSSANNFDAGATVDDKSCTYDPIACTVEIVSDTDAYVIEKSVTALALSFVHSAWNAVIPGATWIWGDNPVMVSANNETQTFQNKFGFVGSVTNATLYIASDNYHSATLNTDAAGSSAAEDNFRTTTQKQYDVTSLIDQGNNELDIAVTNKGPVTNPASNPAGVLYKLVIEGEVTSDADCAVDYEPPYEPNNVRLDGIKWNDVGADGSDANDERIAGWGITATNGSTTMSTTTNSEGYYYFDVDLKQGPWTVTEENRSGWTQTAILKNEGTVDECVWETIDDGRYHDCDFGNHEEDTYTIYGYVWNDDNNNADWDNRFEDGEESSLAGWSVSITNGSTTLATTTDETGYYYFDVPAGTWTITETVENGWQRTTQESHVVTVPELQQQASLLQSIFNAIIPTAHAAVVATFGEYNFGNDKVVTPGGGGGGGGPAKRTSAEGTVLGASIDAEVTPEPLVLGEQVDAVPVGAPNAGAGGTSPFALGFSHYTWSAILTRSRRHG